MEKIKKGLQSNWLIPIVMLFGFICWIFQIYSISVCALAIFVAVVFFFCDDVKNVFIPVLYVSFFINDIAINANWLIYGICIGTTIVSMIYFVIKQFVIRKSTLKKGKLFWALVIADVAFLLGGIIGNFNITSFLITFGFCVVSYFFYWIAINCCVDIKKYFAYLLTCGAILVSLQIYYLNIKQGNIINSIVNRNVAWIGAQNINSAALFVCFGIISSFALGFKKKFDYLYSVLSCFFLITVILTFCRTATALALLAFLVFGIISVCKSNKKINYLFAGLGVIGFLLLLLGVFYEPIMILFQSIFARLGSGGSGREELWPWCWEKFKEYPIFGYGFVSQEAVPSLRNVVNLVLAHNTILQWLTSLGVVGSLMMCYFYFKKYQITLKKVNLSKIFTIGLIILIELSGFFDQTAVMDIFVYIISLLLIGVIENENCVVKEDSLKQGETKEDKLEIKKVKFLKKDNKTENS